MSEPTRELVQRAYQALASEDTSEIAKYYHSGVRWLVPGNHPLAGWYEGRDAFLQLMGLTRMLTGDSFTMERIAIMTGDGFSADLCMNTGTRTDSQERSSSPYDRLHVAVLHLLTWKDGKIIEGRDALFGDDATNFSQFWSQLNRDGYRSVIQYIDAE
jgi:ketosteroid isomerase-like protein